MSNQLAPQDADGRPILGTGYDPTTHQFAVPQVGAAQNDATTGTLSAPNIEQIVAGGKATYTYAISATAPYATPTDWIVIRGSTSRTAKLVRVEISGAATAATEVIFTLKKHTVANTGGTSSSPTPMQHDSTDGPATAT